MADIRRLDAGGQTIAVRNDLRVPMRDGVTLAADVYSGVEDKPRPALVALSPYGKELQALALTMPPQRRPRAFTDRIRSRMLETCSPEEVAKRVAERLADPDVAAWPNLVHVLHYPTHHRAPGARSTTRCSAGTSTGSRASTTGSWTLPP